MTEAKRDDFGLSSRVGSLMIVFALTSFIDSPRVVADDVAERFAIERSITYAGALSRLINVDLGVLQAGKKGDVAIQIKNDSGREFKINKISVGCSCLSAKSIGDVIPIDGSVKVNIEMGVPARAVSPKQSQFLRIDQSETETIQLSLTYELAGTGCFKVSSVTEDAALDSDLLVFKIPMLVTAPSSIDRLRFTASGSLSEMQMKATEIKGEHFLECKLSTAKTGSLALAGEVVVRDIETGVQDSVPCFVNRETQVVISPSVIRFSKLADHWEASAIVRYNTKSTSSKSSSPAVKDLSIGCKVDGDGKLTIDSTQIREGVYRVKLKFTTNPDKQSNSRKPPELPKKIAWQVGWENGIAEPSTAVTF